MEKFYIVGLFASTISLVSTQCPPLQAPEGMEIQCMDSSSNFTNATNAPVDCLTTQNNLTSVSKGVAGRYRCKNGSDSEWANSTVKCICRGRWKGIQEFNEFANKTCGSLPIVLPDLSSDISGSGENDSSTEPTTPGMNATSLSTNPDNSTSTNNTSSPENLNSSASTVFPSSDNSTNPLSLMADNSTANASDSSSTTASSVDNLSSTPSSSANSSAITAVDTSSANSTTTASTMAPSDNSSSTAPSLDTSSTTASSLDNSSSTASSLDNSSSTASPSDNSSTTVFSSSSSSGPNDLSQNSTTMPSVAPEDSNQTPNMTTTNTTDRIGSRESKDLKLSPETLTQANSSTELPSSNGTNASSISNSTNSPIPTTGANLAVMNSSPALNATGNDSPTTTPSSLGSSSLTTTPSSTGTTLESSVGNATSLTSNPNSNGSNSDAQTVALQLHNKLRKNHGSQPLVLNQTMNDIAQSWVENLIQEGKLITSPGKRSYSENLFKISGGDTVSEEYAIESALKAWYSSSKWFNFTNPKPTGFSQIVWNATTQLGIGIASANDSTVVVATYFPRGNIVSVGTKVDPGYYFKKNVFPEISNPEVVFSDGESNATASTPKVET